MLKIYNYKEIENGYGIWCHNQVYCQIVDGVFFYQRYKHKGMLQTSIKNEQLIIASEDEEDLNNYIILNNLKDINSIKEIWHEPDTNIRIIQKDLDLINMLKYEPKIGLYKKENDINDYEEGRYIYFYVNYLLEEHKILLEIFNSIITNK